MTMILNNDGSDGVDVSIVWNQSRGHKKKSVPMEDTHGKATSCYSTQQVTRKGCFGSQPRVLHCLRFQQKRLKPTS